MIIQHLNEAFVLENEKFKIYETFINEKQILNLKKAKDFKLSAHHIIPRCWYKYYGYELDNSESNVVILENKDHMHAHFLLLDYYNSINDELFASKMITTLQLFTGKKSGCYIDFKSLPNTEREKLEYKYQQAMAQYSNFQQTLITNGVKDRKWMKNKQPPSGWRFGSCMSSIHNKNRVRINNGKIQRNILRSQPIPDGWRKGSRYKHTANTKWITNGIEEKLIKIDDPIPSGWRRGHRPRTKNYIYINNGKEHKMIPNTNDIPNGWIKGKL